MSTRGLDAGRLGLQRLGAADLAAVAAHGRVERHVLRLERRDAEPVAPQEPDRAPRRACSCRPTTRCPAPSASRCESSPAAPALASCQRRRPRVRRPRTAAVPRTRRAGARQCARWRGRPNDVQSRTTTPCGSRAWRHGRGVPTLATRKSWPADGAAELPSAIAQRCREYVVDLTRPSTRPHATCAACFQRREPGRPAPPRSPTTAAGAHCRRARLRVARARSPGEGPRWRGLWSDERTTTSRGWRSNGRASQGRSTNGDVGLVEHEQPRGHSEQRFQGARSR